MAIAKIPPTSARDPSAIRDAWLARLGSLVDLVERWAEGWDWPTRRISKAMDDPEIGPYEAPALLIQAGVSRMMLDPIARSAPGAEGVVDLYRMPAYDDIASLYYYDDRWMLHDRMTDPTEDGPDHREEAKSLTESELRQALEGMRRCEVG